MTSRAAAFAPVPDFRYVGLEPIPARELGVASAAVALGAVVVLGQGFGVFDGRQALVTSAAAAIALLALGAARRRRSATGSVRMGIVPWGVLVHADEAVIFLHASQAVR